MKKRIMILKARSLGISQYVAARFLAKGGTLVCPDEKTAESVMKLVERLLASRPTANSSLPK